MQVASTIPSSHLNLNFSVSRRSIGRTDVDGSWNSDMLDGLFATSNMAKRKYNQQLDGEWRCSTEGALKARIREAASVHDNNGTNAQRWRLIVDLAIR
ncbi:unnamed protein product [Caenorhabditis brenneri]